MRQKDIGVGVKKKCTDALPRGGEWSRILTEFGPKVKEFGYSLRRMGREVCDMTM